MHTRTQIHTVVPPVHDTARLCGVGERKASQAVAFPPLVPPFSSSLVEEKEEEKEKEEEGEEQGPPSPNRIRRRSKGSSLHVRCGLAVHPVQPNPIRFRAVRCCCCDCCCCCCRSVESNRRRRL